MFSLDWDAIPKSAPRNFDIKSNSREYHEKLATRIREFWAARGFYPKVWVSQSAVNGRMGPVWDISSDMVNGLPRELCSYPA